MARFCNLPESAMVEIMSRLPPESLLRFKRVQKSRYGLINSLNKSQWFVAKHLKNSERNLLLFSSSAHIKNKPCDFAAKISFLTLDKKVDGKDKFYFNVEEFDVLRRVTASNGSPCDGILFLPDEDTNTILLCNPATKKFKLLQNPCFGSDFKEQIITGLGFDAVFNAYKIVRVVRLRGNGDARFGAEVCTFGTNYCSTESWREIGMDKIEINRTHVQDQVQHKGVYYWLMTAKFSSKKRLILFDMHEEEFQTIPLPEDDDPGEFGGKKQLGGPHRQGHTRGKITTNWKLALWGESLTWLKYVSVIFPAHHVEAKPVKMWVMDRHHESFAGGSKKYYRRWIKYPSLFPQRELRELYYPLVFWNRDEILRSTCQAGCSLASCNLRGQKFRSVQLNWVKRLDGRF